MPSMKGLSMNRVLGTIKKKTGGGGESSGEVRPPPANETPEAAAVRSLKQFCEAGQHKEQGDEVLFLPPIVDAAESSPAAAAECARQIRKYLSKDYKAKSTWQYNAIMVMRILADNPGPSFTRNIDWKFVDAVRDLVKISRERSVLQILMETLEDFERSKSHDQGLWALIGMWREEKGRAWSRVNGYPPQQFPPQTQTPPWVVPQQQSHNYFARDHSNRKLPSPVELANRLEEARTSAKLLSQVVVNTPPQELLNNELVKEFSNRCQSASKSIQIYMVAEDPAPDNDTMEALIDANEQLQTALNQHQRAVLGARKHHGGSQPTVPSPDTRPPPSQVSSSSSIGKARGNSAANEPAGGFEPPRGPPPAAAAKTPEDPFRDPQSDSSAPRLAYEPYHPGVSASPSYLNRQESAYDHTTMHGGAGATSSAKPQASLQDDEDLYDSKDLYSSGAKRI